MVGKLPTAPLRQTVVRRSRPYALDRRQPRDDSKPGSGEQYEADAVITDLYVYSPTSNETVTAVGEQSRGALTGLCLPDADVKDGDRIDYGNNQYELVEPIEGLPNERDPSVLQLTFERVTNPTTDVTDDFSL